MWIFHYADEWASGCGCGCTAYLSGTDEVPREEKENLHAKGKFSAELSSRVQVRVKSVGGMRPGCICSFLIRKNKTKQNNFYLFYSRLIYNTLTILCSF